MENRRQLIRVALNTRIGLNTEAIGLNIFKINMVHFQDLNKLYKFAAFILLPF